MRISIEIEYGYHLFMEMFMWSTLIELAWESYINEGFEIFNKCEFFKHEYLLEGEC